MNWNDSSTIDSQEYVCGYCQNKVASAKGYYTGDFIDGFRGFIYICPHCRFPSYFYSDLQVPGVASGNDVDHLPDNVARIYKEARQCVAANCYTAAVLVCRKLLMHIAVTQGAKGGQTFFSYVQSLADLGYVPPNGQGWVDHIRSKGNEANHEIHLMGREDAEELIAFSEMLLKFIYEFPAKIPNTSEE